MQLIRANADGTLTVCEDAASRLSSLRGKLAVCTVAGVYRSGKSFLLNQLTGAPKGFAVGSTVQACTKGIWMWGEPLELSPRTPGDEPLNVLFLDTEGLSSICQDDNHDAKIFSLAILLSSMFVYNGDKVVNNAAIDSLSLVANLTERVRAGASGAEAGGKDKRGADKSAEEDALADELPDFVWLLRDAFLEMVDEQGREMSARQYLEDALRPTLGEGAAAAERNETRAAITRLFRRRELFALPHPTVGTDVKVAELAQLSDLSRLAPDFREAIGALRAHVTSAIRPKGVGGSALSPAAYLLLVRSYVDSINKGAVPQIHAAWASIATSECERAAAEASDLHRRELRAAIEAHGGQPEAAQLETAHAHALARARAAYAAGATGPSAIVRAGEARLEKAAADELAQQAALLDARSAALCATARSAARDALAKATAQAALPGAGPAEAEAWARSARAAASTLLASARGPARGETLGAFGAEDVPAAAEAALFAFARRAADAAAECGAARAEAGKARKDAEAAAARAAEAEARAAEARAKHGAAAAESDARARRAETAAESAAKCAREAEARAAEALAARAAAEARVEAAVAHARDGDDRGAAERARLTAECERARAEAADAAGRARAAEARAAELSAAAAAAREEQQGALAQAARADAALASSAVELARARGEASASLEEAEGARRALAAVEAVCAACSAASAACRPPHLCSAARAAVSGAELLPHLPAGKAPRCASGRSAHRRSTACV